MLCFLIILTVVLVVLLEKLRTKLENIQPIQHEIQSQRNVILALAILFVVIPFFYFLIVILQHQLQIHHSYTFITVVFVIIFLALLLTELTQTKIYCTMVLVCICCIVHSVVLVNLVSGVIKHKCHKKFNINKDTNISKTKNKIVSTESKIDDILTNIIRPVNVLIYINNFIQKKFTSEHLEQLDDIVHFESLQSLINYNEEPNPSRKVYYMGNESDSTLQELFNTITNIQDKNSPKLLEIHKELRSYRLVINNAYIKYSILLQSAEPLDTDQNLSSLKSEIISTLKKGNNIESVTQLEKLFDIPI
jgi:hypothetical protein